MLKMTFFSSFLIYLGIYGWSKASKSPLDRNVSWLKPLIPHLIACISPLGRFLFCPVPNGDGDRLAARPNCLPTPSCQTMQRCAPVPPPQWDGGGGDLEERI